MGGEVGGEHQFAATRTTRRRQRIEARHRRKSGLGLALNAEMSRAKHTRKAAPALVSKVRTAPFRVWPIPRTHPFT